MAAGFMAQGCPGFDALVLASYIHGLTSEIIASESAPRSMIPTDITDNIGRAVFLIESGKMDDLLGGNPYWTARL
jgi:NAD(P)H-hydrate repair Nnr-like enzyme with NAD(P)H-hydrate dehydratase domain